VTVRKKLIEVSIPLEAINVASAREKSIRHGHPSTLHLWWARRPLAACRAVLFAQFVDDPSSWPGRYPFPEIANTEDGERKRLHKIIERLVPWEASNDERILNEARWEIARSVAWGLGEEPPLRDDGQKILDYLQTKAPPVYDPFCGGGSIPLQGAGRDPTEIRRIAAGESRRTSRAAAWRHMERQGRARTRRGRAVLRSLDAQGGGTTHRLFVPEGAVAGWNRGDRDRLAVGAHCALARSGGQERHGAPGLFVSALDQGGQEGLG